MMLRERTFALITFRKTGWLRFLGHLDVVRAFETASGQTVPLRFAPRRPGDIAARAMIEIGVESDQDRARAFGLDPTAIAQSLQTLVSGVNITTVRDGNSAELPAPEALRAVFERLGVSGSSRVILYGDTLAATRAFFTLDYLGHTGAALLDGGLEKWRAEGRPLTADVPSVKPGVFNVKPRPEVVVTFEQMRKLSEAAQQPGSGVVIIDSRSPEVAAKGRIPGAKVVYWADAQRGRDDPTLKAAEDIARLYGLDALKTVVTYCNSGVQATHGYFVLRYLGYDDVRMYDGSFSEWSRHPEVLIQH